MSTGLLAPVARQRAFTNLGVTAGGAKLYTYAGGTTNPLPTYPTAALDVSTPNANPVVAAASGLFGPIYLLARDYSFVLTDTNGVAIWSQDHVNGSRETDLIVTPYDFGAVGNGIVDDTAAVQAAATAAAGGTLLIPSAGTFLCTANIAVPVGAATLVNVIGTSWFNGGLLFSGAAVTTGLTFAGSAYDYCGTVSDLHILCASGAKRGITFSNVNHPRAQRMRINGAAGCGIKYDLALMGVLDHVFFASCGSATEGIVEVDHSTTFLWLHSRISGANASPLGGLLVDRTSNLTVIGGNIESCGIPIKLGSKAEATTPVDTGCIQAIDLENPGTHYVEMGYGWSGGASGGVLSVRVADVKGTPSGATDIQWGAKLKNTTSISFENSAFGLAGGSQTATHWLDAFTNVGTIVRANRRQFGLTLPWVSINNTLVAAATPETDWNAADYTSINATPPTLAGATPSVNLSTTQGGIYRFVKVANGGATNQTKFTFLGSATGLSLFAWMQDANTTFKQSATGAQGELKMLSGADTAGVSDKVYHFICDGTLWHEI